MFISQRLHDKHNLVGFDSGNPGLDRWLQHEALRAQRSGTAAITVWCQADSHVVDGYYAITPTLTAPDGLTRSERGGFSGPIPGYLIAKLALSRHLHGRGLGAQLLLDALETVVAAANVAGGRLVVVDAIDDASFTFYRRCGLAPIGASTRLYARIDAVAASFNRNP